MRAAVADPVWRQRQSDEWEIILEGRRCVVFRAEGGWCLGIDGRVITSEQGVRLTWPTRLAAQTAALVWARVSR